MRTTVLLKYFLLTFFAFAAISCKGNDTESTEKVQTIVDKHGALSVKGTSLVDSQGNVVALRGVSLGWHNWWSRFFDKETIDWLVKDFNIDMVRAAIGVEPDGAYLQDREKAMKCLTNVVDAAIANGIYVIVDWHSHGIYTKEAQEFFTEVATRYKDSPNVIYEVFNEPVEDSWADVKAYSIEVIKTIRKIAPNSVILVGTPHWDQDVHLAADDPIEGFDNLMYTLHFYAATHKQELRDRGDYALSKGLPLFVSECAGMEASGDGNINVEEWNQWVAWMAKNNLSWAAWSIADKNETCSMVQSPESPISNWTDADLKEWGQIVRKTLKSK